jgi:hypothetical protein
MALLIALLSLVSQPYIELRFSIHRTTLLLRTGNSFSRSFGVNGPDSAIRIPLALNMLTVGASLLADGGYSA